MQNEENEFLKELDNKDENGFATEGKPFEDMEIPVKEEEPEEEKPLPFHKDPKIQRFIQKELEKKLESIKPNETQKFIEETKGDTDEIDSVLERIIGNDTPEKVSASRDLKRVLMGLEEKGAQKALQQIQAEREKERQAEIEAERELEQGFENIEENFNVDLSSNNPLAKKTRNDFVEFIRKVAPKDAQGDIIAYPDFDSTFELFQSTRKKPDNSRAKELANRSMSRSSDASSIPVVKDTSWEGVNKFLDSFRK